MPSLDLIVAFVAAARHASFARAAHELGVSPSAIARNIARLETQLGMRLFHRTTRQVTLSEDGEHIYERCLRVVEEVEALEASATQARSAVRGTLRVDMPVSYGRMVVLPVLMELMASHPQLQIDARFSDHVVDIVKEGVDLAIRIGPLLDSGLVARQFDQQFLGIYASPSYLERHGEPESPEALDAHRCILFRMPSTGRVRPWQFQSGRRSYSLLPDRGVRLGDGEALIQAAVGDLGIVQAPTYLAEAEVTRGRLVEILAGFRPPALPISMVFPSQRHVPMRVRVLAEALVGRGGPSGRPWSGHDE